MAIKTIRLELDAYEKLKAKKRPGESFSGVVRRAVFSDSPATGAELFQYFSAGGGDISEAYLNAVEENNRLAIRRMLSRVETKRHIDRRERFMDRRDGACSS
ncbi:MAG: antitoxin VapB family protein [Kiritimatiellae bacterium]|nr:antitoxin VapB family protein [Kiritimatiellia bacterium]